MQRPARRASPTRYRVLPKASALSIPLLGCYQPLLMLVSRFQILRRGLRCACPNCGHWGLLASWFRLKPACSGCGMGLVKSDGFYTGTTSIGYVASIVCVLIPACVLVVKKVLTVTLGIILGIGGSFLFVVALYPVMLCWMVMAYHLALPGELPANGDTH